LVFEPQLASNILALTAATNSTLAFIIKRC
jgi:hypothetical protein